MEGGKVFIVTLFNLCGHNTLQNKIIMLNKCLIEGCSPEEKVKGG